ncbi:MAG: quinone-dependent dihydroorotate dehydrogenase [Chitinophagaceae bacterium]
MYKALRKLLFLFPTEQVHYLSMNGLKLICSTRMGRGLVSSLFSAKTAVPANLLGLHFKNKVGLAAGFDKNASYLTEIEALGFGFVEIGTVTPLAQAGNDQPRLFRLPEDRALINRMGFNNDGVRAITDRLKAWRSAAGKNSRLIVGGNIGKNKVTPNEEAWKDYESCFRTLYEWVDYFVVNVSSPNTPGLRELQEKDSLEKILSHLQTINSFQTQPKPLLLKIAPDLTISQLDDVIEIANKIKLAGLVVANTTISRENLLTDTQKIAAIGAGGLSGAPLKTRSTDVLKYIHDRLDKNIPLIASGGIFSADDAEEKFRAGASLVQVWTGFVYEGPSIVKNIVSQIE